MDSQELFEQEENKYKGNECQTMDGVFLSDGCYKDLMNKAKNSLQLHYPFQMGHTILRWTHMPLRVFVSKREQTSYFNHHIMAGSMIECQKIEAEVALWRTLLQFGITKRGYEFRHCYQSTHSQSCCKIICIISHHQHVQFLVVMLLQNSSLLY